MKKSILLLLAVFSAIVSCKDDNVTKDLELRIRNVSEREQELKVIATLSNDVLELSIKSEDTVSYTWKSPDTKGEGSFDFIVGDMRSTQGYYSNGNIYLQGPLWVTMTDDSIYVNLDSFQE
ncbi:hypothetical protein [Reichenbachiella versicolor]|uniref:hypothetical protein n=1 Tax=Reichenbachiella versicolor TaxID=1821036 RepID=UPI000D6E6AA3|nr:hypothetical protein [Reichenbachiella versicolor]